MQPNKINFSRNLPLTAKLLLLAPVMILYIHYFLPQNWGFFIKKPNAGMINVYKVDNGNISGPFIQNNMSYGMGVSRKGRVLYKELSILINDHKNLVWQFLDKDSLSQLIRNGSYILIPRNTNKFYKGKYLITRAEQLSDSAIKSGTAFIPTPQYALAEIR